MATIKTTIELNGKLYDARTGKVITQAKASQPVITKKPAQRTGKVVDGFVRRTNPAPQPVAPTTVKSVPVKKIEMTPAKPKPKVNRSVAAHAKPTLQKSQTLMRPAVKKPKPVAATAGSASVRHGRLKKEDPQRVHRAVNTPKSNLVQRFNRQTAAPAIVKKQATLPVTPAPAVEQISNKVAQLATSAEAQVKHSVDIIEESLRSATAHLEVYEEKVKKSILERYGFRHKGANIASLTVAAFLLVGFFAYQNVPNVEMRVAAARTGVSAHLPNYSPAGFSATHGVKSEPGKVAITFRSNTDNKQYTLTQQVSNWSSDSLLTNHVLANKQPYQTYQDKGKTIYITNDSSATWVNGGVWYKIDGNASLSSDQLLRIANSL